MKGLKNPAVVDKRHMNLGILFYAIDCTYQVNLLNEKSAIRNFLLLHENI